MKTSHTRLYRTVKTIGISIGILLASVGLAYALTSLFTMITTRLPNTKGVIEFKIKIDSLENQKMAVVPGSEQSISTSITNDSGTEMFMFVRIDCGTYGDDEKIYSFTPESEEGEPRWTVIDGVAEKNGQIVLAWTNADGKLRPVDAQDSVGISGTLTCVVPITAFDGLTDTDMVADFTGFGISTEESDNPATAYSANVVARHK